MPPAYSRLAQADQYLLELVPAFNKIQDCYNSIGQTCNLNLPQIVVVGAQSAGKSSVLESLIGREILPRGAGIVTRCPITLHLYNINPGEGEERYEFTYPDRRPNLVLTDANKVRDEIEKETNRLAVGKNISHTPIVLNIYSPNVLTFSLVDLPGLFKNIQKDQDQTAAEDVERLVRQYVSNENAIMLVVWPAGDEIANSEALKLAQEYDSMGKRTMVVLTKLDLMNPGTDAKELLDGKTGLALKSDLGIYGVVGRSQEDIQNNVSIHDAKLKEDEFMRNQYPEHLRRGKVGCTALGLRLQKLLLERMHHAQMYVEQQVNAEIEKTEKVLKHLGTAIEPNNYLNNLMEVIHDFEEKLKDRLFGRGDVPLDKLEGGSKIHEEFFSNLPKELDVIDINKTFNQTEIAHAFANYQAVGISIFGNPQVMKRFLCPAIENFRPPVEMTLEQVGQILREIVADASAETKGIYTRFARLITAVEIGTNDFISRQLQHTKEALSAFIKQEQSLLNFNHPLCKDLYRNVSSQDGGTASAAGDGKEKVCNLPQTMLPRPLPSNNAGNLEVQKDFDTNPAVTKFKTNDVQHAARMINAYFEIVRMNVRDTVPKLINYQFLDYTAENLFKELIEKFKNPNDWEALMMETEEIVQQRQQMENKLKKMKQAATAMNDIKGIQARHAFG